MSTLQRDELLMQSEILEEAFQNSYKKQHG
jgi:hypothetical protein